MGIIKQTGLKGLPSLNDLTEEQKTEWYTANPKSATRTFEQNNTIYKNQQFISRFGKKVFDSGFKQHPLQNRKKTGFWSDGRCLFLCKAA